MNLTESTVWDRYYSDWGFIRPNGRIERDSPKLGSDGHTYLAQALGFSDVESAIKAGLAKFAIIRSTGTTQITLLSNHNTKKAVAGFLKHLNGGKTELEVHNHNLSSIKLKSTYSSPEQAANALLALREAYQNGARNVMTSPGSLEYGFISTQGRIIRGVNSLNHQDLAQRYFRCSSENAIARGNIRYLITVDGDLGVEMRDGPRNRSHLLDFVSKNRSVITGSIYVDMVDRDDKVVMAQKFNSRGHLASELVGYPIQEAVIGSTNAQEWGFLKPGKGTLKGRGFQNHTTLAKQLGYKNEHQAVGNGLIRYVIGKNGEANFELVRKRKAINAVLQFIENSPLVGNNIYIDYTDKQGNLIDFDFFENAKHASARLSLTMREDWFSYTGDKGYGPSVLKSDEEDQQDDGKHEPLKVPYGKPEKLGKDDEILNEPDDSEEEPEEDGPEPDDVSVTPADDNEEDKKDDEGDDLESEDGEEDSFEDEGEDEEEPVKEDAPVNNTSGVAGLNPNSVPGPAPIGGNNIWRRRLPVKPDDKFAGYDVFDVDSDTFHRCRFGKPKYHQWKQYVGESDKGQDIRAYGRHTGKPIIIRDKTTGAMTYLRHDIMDKFRRS